MATSDLTNELLSPSMEPAINDSISFKVVDAVLNTLTDKNGEVQNIGVKWSVQFSRQQIDSLVSRHWCQN